MKLTLCLESKLAVVVGLTLGLAAVVLMPPAITYDGPSHYFRSLQVSEGTVRAQIYSGRAVGGTLPAAHIGFVNALWFRYWVDHDFGTLRDWAEKSQKAAADPSRAPVEFTNTAVYSPLNYAFQAAGMRLATWLARSPLWTSRLGCLFDLAGYLLVIVIALEKLPHFRRGLLLLATCPLIIAQAASLSTDAINFSLPVLLLAWTWRVRVGPTPAPRKELGILFGLGLLVVLLKPTAIVALGCLVLLPSERFGSRRSMLLWLAGYFAAALGVWWLWNRPNLGIDIARWFVPSRLPASVQKEWFLHDPRHFGKPLLQLLRYDLAPQWTHLYADVGGWVPPVVFDRVGWLSYLFLAAFALAGEWKGKTDWIWAGGNLALAAIALVLLALTLWLAFGTQDRDWIPGLVGRYLVVVLFGLGIAGAEIFHIGFSRVRSGLFWLALAANAVGLAAILFSVARRVLPGA